MKTKDITLSASLMALYIGINVLGAATPIKVSSIMQSALFGLFWPYFSTRLNLTFQGLRVGWNLLNLIRTAPKLMGTLKIEAIIGLSIFDTAIEKYTGIIDIRAYDLLLALSRAEAGLNFWIFCAGYLILSCGLIPYLFYKYFKYIGLFRRLPSF